MKQTFLSFISSAIFLIIFSAGSTAHACAVCFGGQENVVGPMTMAILFLLVLLLAVLGAFVGFFFYLKKQAQNPLPPYLEATQS
jgi:hypothetical protein